MKFVISHALMKEGMDLLDELGAEVYIADSTDPYSYIDKIKEADALILRQGDFRAPIINECSNLKVIGITGVGFDNVDVHDAAQLGIPTVITPGANQHSVAEQVIACMMDHSKNLTRQDEEIRKGNWAYRDTGKGFQLWGKTVGIIGCGRIGRNVAAICSAMGMKVLGYDITGQAAVEAAGCEYRGTVDEILKESDFVTIHCALTADTEGLIGKRELELMKPTAYLMNLARGPIVDEQALADAVNNGVISGAAVDVYSVEPVSSDNPVLTAKNILCTPHTSGIAAEALARMSVMCVEGCAAIIRGERWDAVADRSVYDHSRFA